MKIVSVFFFAMSIFCVLAGADERGKDYNVRNWNSGVMEADGQLTFGEKPLEKHRIRRREKPEKKYLKGKKAENYIGNLPERLLSGTYTAKILMRKKPDPKNSRKTDGIIFNTNGGNFGFTAKKDSYYEIILDTQGGYSEQKVDRENFDTLFNYINDEKMNKPFVVFDKEGNEAAIIYSPFGTLVKQRFTDKGNVYLELRMR